VKISLTLKDANVVKQGQHGIHFHAVGKCDGPDFMTAGAHFNPTSKQHGAKSPQGPHLGDLPNLPIDASTAAQSGYAATLTTKMVTLSAGPASIFDADGTALVIHANPDDEMTDPSGNSGGRIACAVLALNAPGSLPVTGGGAAAMQRDLWQRIALLALATLATTAMIVALSRRRTAKGE
jgi:Cu/Zn superoxide dismutase